MVVNTDMVVASEGATFALPEVKRGVVAVAGALPRLVRTVGRIDQGENMVEGVKAFVEKRKPRWLASKL